MEIPLYVIDAFSAKVFGGNPAAVCPLDAWLDDDLMQAIAAENNLSETAFFVSAGDSYALRWFTPKVEVDLCGHATLATAFVLSLDKRTAADSYRFQTRSGELGVARNGDLFHLDFPVRTLEAPEDPDALATQVAAACAVRPQKVTLTAGNCLAEFDNETIVRALEPDMAGVMALPARGLIVTASGDDCDFVSRFFAPRVGINEDPVTGSIHCSLIPYWHLITGKQDMLARQVSARGGELHCRFAGDRVGIGGRGVLFSRGKITL